LVNQGKQVDVYDFSLNVRADVFYGALEAGKSKTTIHAIQRGTIESDVVLPGPTNFWIAREGQGKAITSLKTFPAETKGFIMEAADLADTFEGIVAMMSGERMQFAVRYKNQPVDAVVSFSARMTDVEQAPLANCLAKVVERMQKNASSR